MPTWDDVGRIAMSLPEVVESVRDGTRVWRVKEKSFVWERPLRKADWVALGTEPNDDPVFCANVADEPEKFALIDSAPGVIFTTPHFNGYPAILGWLDRTTPSSSRRSSPTRGCAERRSAWQQSS